MGLFDRVKITAEEEKKHTASNDLNVGIVRKERMDQLLMDLAGYGEAEYKKQMGAIVEETEWSFYHPQEYIKKAEVIRQKMKRLEGVDRSLQKDIVSQKKDIRKLEQEQIENQNKIEMYKRSLRVLENPASIMNNINRLEQRNELIAREIADDEKMKTGLRTLMQREDEGIKGLCMTLITTLAHAPEHYAECRGLAMHYDIENPFTKLALRAIQSHVEGDRVSAFEYAAKYFESEARNEDVAHTPLLDELYTNYLVVKKDFAKAKDFAKRLVYYAPESVSYHEILRKIHLELDEKHEAQIEYELITLLS